MNDLLTLMTFLNTHLRHHSLGQLVYLTTWLDPLFNQHRPDDQFYFEAVDEEDDLSLASAIARFCFPAVYAELVQYVAQGMSLVALEDFLLTALNVHLPFPLEDLSAVRFGVPLETYGITLDEPETYAHIPEMEVFLDGWRIGEASTMADFAMFRRIGEQLVLSLTAQADLHYHDLAALLQWGLSISGNTLIDFTLDELWESYLELPSWTLQSIQHIREVASEAQELWTSAQRGLTLLAQSLPLQTALHTNIGILSQRLQKARKVYSYVSSTPTTFAPRGIQWPDQLTLPPANTPPPNS